MNLDQLADILVRSVFSGFIFWTFVWVIAKRRVKKIALSPEIGSGALDEIPQASPHRSLANNLIRLDTTAFSLVILAGSLHFSQEVMYWINETWDDEYHQRFFGFWAHPFTYVLLPQFFWINRIRNNNFFRIVFAVWCLFLFNAHQYIVIVSSLHRDYQDFDSSILLGYLGVWFFYLVIFTFLMVCAYYIARMWRTR